MQLAAPPVVVFVLANAFYLGVAQANGFSYLSAGTWSHWDSLIYIQIAEHLRTLSEKTFHPIVKIAGLIEDDQFAMAVEDLIDAGSLGKS